jgi:hypothetical protein
MGNSALPTRGSPLTVQPIYYTTNSASSSSPFYCNKLYIPIHSTVLGFGDNQFNVQRRRSTIVQQSFGRQPTHTDHTPIYISRTAKHLPSLLPVHVTKTLHDDDIIITQQHMQLGLTSFSVLHAPLNQLTRRLSLYLNEGSYRYFNSCACV